jgi:hypothetical protein
MKFPLSILLPILAPCLFFLTSRLIASNSVSCGYSVHPQQGKTGNLLDIIAGDTRTIIGVALLEKADAYYHGGLVDHGDCSVTKKKSETAHELSDDPHNACNHTDSTCTHTLSVWRNPWRYLNQQLQAQAHVHLDLASAEEMLPWYWAACEASPHNIQAIDSASYVLANMAEKPQEALQLLAKGIQDNPNDVTLEISRGEILLKHFNDLKNAELAFLAAYQKSLHEKAPKDDLLKAKALFYLGHIAKQRKDSLALQQWQRVAREIMSPDLISIRNLLELK